MKMVLVSKVTDMFRGTFVPSLEARVEEKVTPLQPPPDPPTTPVIRYRSAWINVRRLLEEEAKAEAERISSRKSSV
jgi:hypothetical protein